LAFNISHTIRHKHSLQINLIPLFYVSLLFWWYLLVIIFGFPKGFGLLEKLRVTLAGK
jgi:cytochrome c oxidase assembly factor CtaG